MHVRALIVGAALRAASAFQGPARRAMPLRLLAETATDVERVAASEFKMITEEEATIRKAGGVFIGLATAAVYATAEQHNYGSLAGGIFAAVSTYRTGSEYQ